MNFSAVSQSGDAKRPKAMAPTAPGKTLSASIGRNDVVKVAVPVWRAHWMAVRLLSGKGPSIVAGTRGAALVSRRGFSSTGRAPRGGETLAPGTRAWVVGGAN